jgi:membrane protease YdiL (CAAX protease family)
MLGALIWALGGEDALPQEPPALVPWIAALPIGLRLALSVSAGFAEEIFFRGFLQPRAGITFSTVLFVMAHVGYGQPLMLVGVTLLSLVFAALVRWRQTIWSAVVAHAVFDALQLTVVIPKALEFLEGAGRIPV